jgi:hypothetical protein
MTFYVHLPPERQFDFSYYNGPYRFLDDAIRTANMIRHYDMNVKIEIYNRERYGVETTIVENMPLLPGQERS